MNSFTFLDMTINMWDLRTEWPDVVIFSPIFGYFRDKMAIFFWYIYHVFNILWPFLIFLNILGLFFTFWRFLTIFGYFWKCSSGHSADVLLPIAMQRIVISSPSFKCSSGWTAGDSAYAGTMGSVQARIVSEGSLVCNCLKNYVLKIMVFLKFYIFTLFVLVLKASM